MKNPYLSLWLSGANAWAGAMRGFWTAEMQRQQTQMMHQMTEQWVRAWTDAWSGGHGGKGGSSRR